MKRPEKYKQPDPAMQITAIISSLSGHKSNFEDGIINFDTFSKSFDNHIEELLELSKDLHGKINWG